jgi:hypothetical protein
MRKTVLPTPPIPRERRPNFQSNLIRLIRKNLIKLSRLEKCRINAKEMLKLSWRRAGTCREKISGIQAFKDDLRKMNFQSSLEKNNRLGQLLSPSLGGF